MNEPENQEPPSELRPSVIIFWTIVLTFFVVWRVSKDNYGYFQTVVLTLTLFAIVWYTIETRRMQLAVSQQGQELIRQRRLNIMPAFVARIVTLDRADYLELTNIGHGVAINIRIDPVEIRFPTSKPGSITFEEVLMIHPNEKKLFESTTYLFGLTGEAEENKLTFLQRYAHYNAEVNIRFQDIEGGKYIQTVKMGKDGYEHGFVKPYD